MTGQPRRAAGGPRGGRLAISLVLIVAALAVLGYVSWQVEEGNQPPSFLQSALPQLQPSASSDASEPSAAASEKAAFDAKCTAVDKGFVPNRYSIERLGVSERVLALNLDDEGNIAAPPKNEPRLASWWSGGPQPGAERGQALLTIHSYRNGGAVGNQLFANGQSHLQEGDVLKLYGPKGQVQCYEYTSVTKIAVSDYDPQSDLMIDFQGKPRLAIVICWDFDPGTENWNSRAFFHFTPVKVKA